MKYFLTFYFLIKISFCTSAQQKQDSAVFYGKNIVTLKEVVVNNKLDVNAFISRIENDTSFYKAFRNLRILGYSSINDIRMNNKKGRPIATLHSKTRQLRNNNCRSMQTLEETTTGDFYDKNHDYNYYTAELYASLFFTKGLVCGETNIVKGSEITSQEGSSLDRHKNQLKLLFFNPGKKITGIPLISNKTAIFDEDIARRYNMEIDMQTKNNISCYVYRQTVKPEYKNDVVIDSMITWFNEKTYDVVARDYNLNYNAGAYSFDVKMQVEMTRFGELNVPALIRYVGDWKIVFRSKERGVFTATFFDFTK